MRTAEIQNMLPKIQRFFATQPVSRAYLFGSCSRVEEQIDSDVDIMVDFELLPFAQESANQDKFLIYERA